MVNVDLSTMFWVRLLGQPRPDNPWIRELPGILLIGGYFVVLPPLFAKSLFKKFFAAMGAMRFHIMMHLFLWFVLIPIKMGLRWTVSLKYFISIPEKFFNV
jgi:hypothetical protein